MLGTSLVEMHIWVEISSGSVTWKNVEQDILNPLLIQCWASVVDDDQNSLKIGLFIYILHITIKMHNLMAQTSKQLSNRPHTKYFYRDF